MGHRRGDQCGGLGSTTSVSNLTTEHSLEIVVRVIGMRYHSSWCVSVVLAWFEIQCSFWDVSRKFSGQTFLKPIIEPAVTPGPHRKSQLKKRDSFVRTSETLVFTTGGLQQPQGSIIKPG